MNQTAKFLIAFSVVTPAFSPFAYAQQELMPQSTSITEKATSELFMKLSQPDSFHTAFGFSYGRFVRGFAYLDLQDVPAKVDQSEKQFHVPGYGAGVTLRSAVPVDGKINPSLPLIGTFTDIYVQYSEDGKAIRRADYWTLGVQPGIRILGANGVSMSLGFDFKNNFIESMSTEKQEEFAQAGVTSRSLTPSLSLHIQL